MFIKDVNKNEILLPVIFSGNALKIATFINSTRGILKTVKIDFYKPKKKKTISFYHPKTASAQICPTSKFLFNVVMFAKLAEKV